MDHLRTEARRAAFKPESSPGWTTSSSSTDSPRSTSGRSNPVGLPARTPLGGGEGLIDPRHEFGWGRSGPSPPGYTTNMITPNVHALPTCPWSKSPAAPNGGPGSTGTTRLPPACGLPSARRATADHAHLRRRRGGGALLRLDRQRREPPRRRPLQAVAHSPQAGQRMGADEQGTRRAPRRSRTDDRRRTRRRRRLPRPTDPGRRSTTSRISSCPATWRRHLRPIPRPPRGFAGFTSSVRKMILYRISEAKRPETRARRIEQTVTAAAGGRPPWPAERAGGPEVKSAASAREIRRAPLALGAPPPGVAPRPVRRHRGELRRPGRRHHPADRPARRRRTRPRPRRTRQDRGRARSGS